MEQAIALDDEWRAAARGDEDLDGIRTETRFQVLVEEVGEE